MNILLKKITAKWAVSIMLASKIKANTMKIFSTAPEGNELAEAKLS